MKRSISTTLEGVLLRPLASQFPGNSHDDFVLVVGSVAGKFGPAVLRDVDRTGSSDPSRVKAIGNVHLEFAFRSCDDGLKTAVGLCSFLVVSAKVPEHYADVRSKSIGVVIVRISTPRVTVGTILASIRLEPTPDSPRPSVLLQKSADPLSPQGFLDRRGSRLESMRFFAVMQNGRRKRGAGEKKQGDNEEQRGMEHGEVDAGSVRKFPISRGFANVGASKKR